MTVPLWPGIETGGQVCGREVAKCQQFEPRDELGDPTCLIVLLLDDHHAGMAACKAVRERSIGMGALVNGKIQAHGGKGRVYDIPVAPISLLLSNGQLLEHEAELVPSPQQGTS